MIRHTTTLLALVVIFACGGWVFPEDAHADSVTLSLKSEIYDGNGGFTMLDGASSVFVSGNYAYVASQYDNSLTIVDISNPSSPVLKSQVYDGDGEFNRLAGAWSVYVSGNYAYVASAIDNSLTIMDITNPLDPVKKSEVYDADGEFNRLSGASSVFVSGNYAYVAAFGDSALTIIDITNPLDPVKKSEVYDGDGEFTKLWSAWSVYVSGNYAYVASYDDLSLTIMDISNPLDPVKKSEVYDGDGEFTKLYRARSVYVSGNYAYVASEMDNSLTIMDISNPLDPVKKAEIYDGNGGYERLGEANSVFVSGNYAYVAGSFDNGITVIDISDPANPVKKAEVYDGDGTFNKLGYPFGIFVHNNYVYVASETDDSLTIMEAVMSAGTQSSSSSGSNIRLPYVQTVYMGNDLTSTSASVIWLTDISSYSQIDFGTTSGTYTHKTALDDTLVSFHTMSLGGLQPNTKYYFRVVAGQALDQKAYSSEYSFTTRPTADSTSLPLYSAEGMTAGSPAVVSSNSGPATVSPGVTPPGNTGSGTTTATTTPPVSNGNTATTTPGLHSPEMPVLPIPPAQLPSQAQASVVSPVFNRDLEIGARNDETQKLQEFLAKDPELYPEGLVTGYFGPLTQKAVERFQRRYGIVFLDEPNPAGAGRVGPLTRAKLNELMGASETAPRSAASLSGVSAGEREKQIEAILAQIKALQKQLDEMMLNVAH